MRHNGAANPAEAKRIARRKYAERKVDKWIKWSWEMQGKVMFRELVNQQEKYGMKC
jgi:hypothetical protein